MSDPSLRGRVVMITGGSRGLGRQMALALAGAGARLCLTGAAPSAALEAARAEAEALGAEAIALPADVADPEAAAGAVAACEDRFGRIDVLVNNAGLGMRAISEDFTTRPTRFWEADPAAWRRITAINVDGPFLVARASVPGMVARGFGKVINVSTSPPTMVRAGYSPYGPSKAFLEATSRVWAQDLAGTGVDVNVLLPGGATATDLLPPGARGADGNLLNPAIMRAPILWLASDASNGVTGTRYVARLWDGPDAARAAPAGPPSII